MIPGIEAFDELEDLAETTREELEKDLSTAQKSILSSVLDELGKLVIIRGSIQRSTANYRALREIIRGMEKVIGSNPALLKAFQKYFKAFNATTGLVEGYAATLGSTAEYTGLTNLLIQNTADNLLQFGVNGEFRKGIVETLTTHVTTGAPLGKLRTALAETLESKPLTRYAGQVADDALNQYSRAYINAVTEDLGLEHYFYKGTKIETSRPFCMARTGKFFTKKEVESWASLEWAGKIPGTDKDTIKTLLAGYRCRHRLIPVTKAVYDANK